jgi:hypothetical protein
VIGVGDGETDDVVAVVDDMTPSVDVVVLPPGVAGSGAAVVVVGTGPKVVVVTTVVVDSAGLGVGACVGFVDFVVGCSSVTPVSGLAVVSSGFATVVVGVVTMTAVVALVVGLVALVVNSTKSSSVTVSVSGIVTMLFVVASVTGMGSTEQAGWHVISSLSAKHLAALTSNLVPVAHGLLIKLPLEHS